MKKIIKKIIPFKKHLYKIKLLFDQITYSFKHHKANPSYSQTGEDLIIQSIFNCKTYLDIGAHHPIRFSNTYLFYLNGARGICIDADSSLSKEFKRIRPKDTFLNIAIGPKEECKKFYIFNEKAINTLSEEMALKSQTAGYKIEKTIQVELKTINSILETYFQSKAPEFLSIDIEGLDFIVLQTFDFKKYRPKVFCIETTVKKNEIIKLMNQNSYSVYANTKRDTIFVDKENL